MSTASSTRPKNPAGISRRRFLESSLTIGAAAVAAAAGEKSATPTLGGPWQIGCYTRPWGAYDWRVALDAIAEAGFKHAGLMTANTKTGLVISAATTVDEARAVGEECRKRGLQVPSLWGGGFAVAKSLEAGIQDLTRLIDNCAACGAANLMIGGTGDPRIADDYYKAVAEVCDYAAAKKIGLSVKPHGGQNATGAQCRKIVEKVGKKNFGLWYDPGNIYYYSNGELDPVEDAAGVDGIVVGMSVKDFRPPKEVMVTPGTGQVNFAAVMARLRRGGFTRGPLVIECLEKGDLPKLAVEARKARRFLDELLGR
ncbi:MAG TPA: sugar phosphate isomerase/epimerase family protein [Candidatus Paceibacterota bacterium]|nr:sugar phosphate isomerase/epimerase [Verrucomicrobiota bacterium]HOX02113.1 sugar phosphate isomerase/epimerase family protein [Verrucomicrobiota bacterium]HRZ44945.1 sugar phosphate isomerase/epimerase family protein [Candidatus Paceibacterota bacterium]HRZ92301.1 sugar phosphate isomerase/epimerase family protein [Candidatus Paceibacterota bacterium]